MNLQRILNNSNVRNGAFFALFSFINMGLNFIIMLALARFILPDSYGQLSLFTTMVTILSMFICLGVNSYKSVKFFNSDKLTIQRLINVTLIITLLVYMIILVAIVSLPSFFTSVLGVDTLYQFYALTYCLTQIVCSELLDVWRLEEKVWRYGTFTILSMAGNLVLTLLLVGTMNFDWQGRVYAMLITSVVFSLLSVYVLKRKGYLILIKPRKDDFKEAVQYGLPLIPHGISFWLRQGFDRYVINAFISQTVVGLFSFAFNFANVIQIIGSAFNSSNSVYIFKTLSGITALQFEGFQRNCRLLVFFYIGLTLVVFLGSSLFIPILFPNYSEAVPYILPLCIGSMFQCFYLVYVNILLFYSKTKQLVCITFTFSLLHAALSLMLTKYGVIYTVCIPILVNSLIAGTVYVYSQRLLRENIKEQ